MNYKRLMATVFIVAMLGMILPVLPVSSTAPCRPVFGVKVEGELTWLDEHIEYYTVFPELTYGLGTEFTIEVWILGVEDMFAYEFELEWTGIDYIDLVGYTVEDVWPEQVVVKPDTTYEIYFPYGYPDNFPYKQVVSALPPSTGVSGDIKLATLTFEIINDICYCEGSTYFRFDVKNEKVSDSCSQEITPCTDMYGWVKFVSKAPDIMMVPNNETNSAIYPYDGKFTKEIWVSNVVKMKSLYFELRWNKNNEARMVELVYVEFDKTNLAHMEPVDPATIKEEAVGDEMRIKVSIKIKCTATPLRGTFRVMTLTFKKLDPWPCGQPKYTYKQPHEWTPENATTDFYFYKGYFDVYCPDLNYIYFGSIFDADGDGNIREHSLGTLIDHETLFNGTGADALDDTLFENGPDPNYGTAEWVVCEEACEDGGSVNLTTYVDYDVAGVGFKVSSIPVQDINWIRYLYRHTLWNDYWPGPRMMIGVNGTSADRILISEPAAKHETTTCANRNPTLSTREWYAFVWDGDVAELLEGNFSGVTDPWDSPDHTFTDWDDVKSTWTGHPDRNVTFIMLFMGPVGEPWAHDAGSPIGTGSALVDYVTMEIYDVYGNYTETFDLEPPCMTNYFWDKALYGLYQERIVNRYTFVPVPGDLNRDGVVDIVDVMIIANQYGTDNDAYDFQVNGIVDIFDIVVVTKQFGRTSP